MKEALALPACCQVTKRADFKLLTVGRRSSFVGRSRARNYVTAKLCLRASGRARARREQLVVE